MAPTDDLRPVHPAMNPKVSHANRAPPHLTSSRHAQHTSHHPAHHAHTAHLITPHTPRRAHRTAQRAPPPRTPLIRATHTTTRIGWARFSVNCRSATRDRQPRLATALRHRRVPSTPSKYCQLSAVGAMSSSVLPMLAGRKRRRGSWLNWVSNLRPCPPPSAPSFARCPIYPHLHRSLLLLLVQLFRPRERRSSHRRDGTDTSLT